MKKHIKILVLLLTILGVFVSLLVPVSADDEALPYYSYADGTLPFYFKNTSDFSVSNGVITRVDYTGYDYLARCPLRFPNDCFAFVFETSRLPNFAITSAPDGYLHYVCVYDSSTNCFTFPDGSSLTYFSNTYSFKIIVNLYDGCCYFSVNDHVRYFSYIGLSLQASSSSFSFNIYFDPSFPVGSSFDLSTSRVFPLPLSCADRSALYMLDYLDSLHSSGVSFGYDSGFDAGETAGYSWGYSEGSSAGYSSGYSAGETAGYGDGYDTGYAFGYSSAETVHAYDYSNGQAYGEALHANDYSNGVAAGEALHATDYTRGVARGEALHANDYENGYNAGLISDTNVITDSVDGIFDGLLSTLSVLNGFSIFGITLGGVISVAAILLLVFFVLKVIRK